MTPNEELALRLLAAAVQTLKETHDWDSYFLGELCARLGNMGDGILMRIEQERGEPVVPLEEF